MKPKKLVTKNPLYCAFFFPALVDGVVTLVGQGSQYWHNSSIATDASPAYYFLIASPWIFLLGSVVWFTFWYWLFKRLKEPLNLLLMFLFIAGHSWGSSSWIAKMVKQLSFYQASNQFSKMFLWSLLIFYFLIIASLATYCLKRYLKISSSKKGNFS